METPQKRSAKEIGERERKMTKGEMISNVRSWSRPDPLKLGKRDPTVHARFVRNTPESIADAQARGYDVANSDVCARLGIVPRDGVNHKVGDLILTVMPALIKKERDQMKSELAKRQSEETRRGVQGQRTANGFRFNENIKQD